MVLVDRTVILQSIFFIFDNCSCQNSCGSCKIVATNGVKPATIKFFVVTQTASASFGRKGYSRQNTTGNCKNITDTIFVSTYFP